MKILRAEHLVKVYGSGLGKVYALNDVSFTIEEGEFVSIVGASGSGKSTLIHILGTVDEPDSGKVYLYGQDVFAQSPEQLALFRRRKLGIIYQFNTLLSQLTVEENIQLPALLDGRKVDRKFYRELIETLGLTGREQDLPSALSGGQLQRVKIARTLMNNSSVILADEPTGSLDLRNTQEIMALLRHINQKYARTILLITHDEEIALQADRMMHFEHGKLLSDVPLP